jgi:hypothetical protein
MQMKRFAARSTAVKKMATLLQEAKYVLCFNAIKCLKRVQERNRTELVHLLPIPFMHFTNEFCETGCLCKRKVPFTTKWIELEYQLMYPVNQQCICRSCKTKFDGCSLMSKCSDIVLSLIASKYICETVKIICAHLCLCVECIEHKKCVSRLYL